MTRPPGQKNGTITIPEAAALRSVAFTADGRCLALDCRDGTIAPLELATTQVRQTLGEKSSKVHFRGSHLSHHVAASSDDLVDCAEKTRDPTAWQVHPFPVNGKIRRPAFLGLVLVGGVPMRFLLAFLRDERGPAAVEYALVLALIVVACIAAISAIGQSTSGIFASLSQAVKQNGS